MNIVEKFIIIPGLIINLSDFDETGKAESENRKATTGI